ncbi:hypothetical protein [Mesorhizobium sp. M2C.T.Ca.TU.002.02.1.1]|uniref:hypothetical protein n=1 Tax=Mesorhizobium sp. M2C.T.Ca.TU.002.02.1.1 TaxID=2496788 RepID=UPI000FCC8BA4|nr:hypothetical protein [Mesorhizobium sp. M2C.T.Ca.TU.002.02.1.1]RUU57354.1 hypothetical protein EOD04_30080 [Mesorhizobium sp. M2C.T.Ca.TU.009.01.2.1]RUU58536.1 hypothetical protein EOD07_09705 [Mesorhizobium sp. M2C.T.Ca.TU.002.02.1.1]
MAEMRMLSGAGREAVARIMPRLWRRNERPIAPSVQSVSRGGAAGCADWLSSLAGRTVMDISSGHNAWAFITAAKRLSASTLPISVRSGLLAPASKST